jgi:alkanesulfonate monooxygenase SsuD/methylene tetrahydromethanopterin reductase-like flavin-dependent oxidoreductase (luciferase family)
MGQQVGAQPGEQWRERALQVEELGYSTLVMPDGMQLLSGWSALAVAASVTTGLRVGNFVLASPLRPPALAAWDAHSLAVLTDGRYEMGIGTGRPEVIKQAEEVIGLPPTTGAQRLAQVAETIDALRELDGERHTPVMIAAGGPKIRTLAAEKADIVMLTGGPLISRDEFAALTTGIRTTAGDRADAIEFAMNLFVVGDEVPAWQQGFLGVDAATLIEHDSLMMLRGNSPREMADELQRRRDAFGVSYLTVNASFFEEMAPIVELLDGK